MVAISSGAAATLIGVGVVVVVVNPRAERPRGATDAPRAGRAARQVPPLRGPGFQLVVPRSTVSSTSTSARCWSRPSRRRSSPTTTSTPRWTPRSTSRSRATRRASRPRTTTSSTIRSDRQPRPHDAPQHHRHADAQVRQQRARQDQRRAATHPARRDDELGHRDRQDRAEGDRSAHRTSRRR